jgi:hypothetical protein
MSAVRTDNLPQALVGTLHSGGLGTITGYSEVDHITRKSGLKRTAVCWQPMAGFGG